MKYFGRGHKAVLSGKGINSVVTPQKEEGEKQTISLALNEGSKAWGAVREKKIVSYKGTLTETMEKEKTVTNYAGCLD